MAWKTGWMRLKGRITGWQDDRGFGFIEPMTKGEQAFAHISAFSQRGRRPVDGDLVTYSLARDEQGRLRAAKVAWVESPARRSPPRRGRAGTAFAILFLAAMAMVTTAGRLPPIYIALYLVMSLVTFVAYAWDKSSARNLRWRTKESTLHLLALACGWPGALIAQSSLRHKSVKLSFRSMFWITVLWNLAGLSWIVAYPYLG